MIGKQWANGMGENYSVRGYEIERMHGVGARVMQTASMTNNDWEDCGPSIADRLSKLVGFAVVPQA